MLTWLLLGFLGSVVALSIFWYCENNKTVFDGHHDLLSFVMVAIGCVVTFLLRVLIGLQGEIVMNILLSCLSFLGFFVVEIFVNTVVLIARSSLEI